MRSELVLFEQNKMKNVFNLECHKNGQLPSSALEHEIYEGSSPTLTLTR
jgi:hypothetical protein